MEKINQIKRFRGKKILLEYKTDISFNKLLAFLRSCLKEVPVKWRYFIIKEYYHEEGVSVFAFIEFDCKIDCYLKLQLDENQVQGFYQAGLDKGIVLKYFLKSFKNCESSINKPYLTNFPSNEVDSYKRILIIDKKLNENSLSEELPLTESEQSPILIEDGKKEPSSKQLQNIRKHIEAYETEIKKEQLNKEIIRKARRALVNYYYNKTLRLDGQLYRTVQNIVLVKRDEEEV